MPEPGLVTMGRAAGAFGLRGEIRISSHARRPDIFAQAGTVYIGANPESAAAHKVDSWREHRGGVLLKLADVNFRDQAEALAGGWVYLRRQDLDPLEEGEFYWFELYGAVVHTAGGRELGRVKALTDVGPHELLVVEDSRGGELLIPLVDEVVRDLDVGRGRVVVELPEGLLEAQGWEE